MAKNLNISPYYDDFEALKNFHQILFRPGAAVQARELTQIQSILKNQIAKFGDHIFRQGSIVIPGNSRGELGVPYVKLESSFGGIPVDYTRWVGKTVVGQSSGVTGIVKAALPVTGTDALTIYVNYTSGGVVSDVANGKLTFDPGETLQVANDATLEATIQSGVDAIGLGSMAHINEGVYYVNGSFVTVETQSIVISKYSITPSCSVLLQIAEDIVTSDTDATLLDPAQGSYNFAAPGADRLKITLTLTSLPLGSAISDDYVEVMRYNNGNLEEHARTPRYNELEKSLARRTYDESGDYVVSGLRGAVREHLREYSNGGVDPLGSRDNYVMEVSAGKAYINGFETETLSNYQIVLPKARTAAHVKLKEINTRPTFGRYILVSNILGGMKLNERQVVDFYDDNDASNPSALKVGSARVLALDYHIGDPTSNNAIYKLWLTDVEFTSTLKTFDSVGGIRFTGGSAYVIQILNSPLSLGTHNIGNIVQYNSSQRVATVRYWDAAAGDLYVFKHDHTKDSPKVGDQITNATTSASSVVKSKQVYLGSAQNSAIFPLPVDQVKTLRNALNVYDYSYTVQQELVISTDGSGNGTAQIALGEIQSPEVGTFSAFGPAGIVAATKFSLNGLGNELILTAGPVSTTVRAYVTVDRAGTLPRTKSLTQFIDTITPAPGATVLTLSKADAYRILTIADDTGLVTNNYDLDPGQTDYAYFKSSIRLKAGRAAPVGNVIVTYEYFQHSAGDFFTPDSYALNPNFEDYVLVHRSSATGVEYDLSNCIDCRPSVNAANDFAAGAIVGDMLINNEKFTSSLQYYVPRYDLLTINKNGSVAVIQGIPDDQPSIPPTPEDSLALETVFVPAYTESVKDIARTRLAVDRFTMRDISDLSDRVGRLEEFSTLTAAESSVVNYEIIDAETGLSRFKTGYVVETFDNPITIADVDSDQFAAAFDGGSLVASVEEMDCPAILQPNLSSGYQSTQNVISLPYTEKVFTRQPVSSRVSNLNPFLVIKWDGILTVTPNVDNWVEVNDRPAIVQRRTEFVTITRQVRFPGGPVISETRTVSGTRMPTNTSTRIASGKIICTKLHSLGLMSSDIYEADQRFGEYLAKADPDAMAGYQDWAKIVVDWMDGDGIDMKVDANFIKDLATSWAYDIATPWAEEMAFQVGVGSKSNPVGASLMKFGKWISRKIGQRTTPLKRTFATGAMLIVIFAILKAYVSVRELAK